MPEWVRLPTSWIVKDKGLRDFRWDAEKGSTNAAALMTLIALAHRADQTGGRSKATYSDLTRATGISRATLSGALRGLASRLLIVETTSRSVYELGGFDPKRGWAMLPARGLYRPDGTIVGFEEFNLRHRAELDGLKIYLLAAALRSNDTNMAQMSHETIYEYTGVSGSRIKEGLSRLLNGNLIHIEQLKNPEGFFSHAYRLANLQNRRHMGSTGRQQAPAGAA